MEFGMNESEKKLVTVLCATATWILLGIAYFTASTSGLIGSSLNVILSSPILSLMVVEILVAGVVMALGITSYVSIKQNNAYKKAKAMVANETEEKIEKEYIVE